MSRLSSLAMLIALTLGCGVSAPVAAWPTVSTMGPSTSIVRMERLLETTMPTLPTGFATIGVMRWTLRPSPRPLIVPPHDGPRFVLVEAGTLVAIEPGRQTPLTAGELFAPAGAEGEVALHVRGEEEAIVVVVGFQGPDVTWCFWTENPLVHSLQVLLYTPADRLPGGSGRLLLERVTLPPGSRLPPYPANPYQWTSVGAGTLGLTLQGQMPFLWEAGRERRLGPGQSWPQIPTPIANPLMPSGTWMQVRNRGNGPLVLNRLTLAPSVGAVLPAASRGGGSPRS
jgi:hypothetical protein